MVVDTSALLAIIFKEELGTWAAAQFETHAGRLRMSTVNYAEALILIADRQPVGAPEIRAQIESSEIQLVPPTVRQAEMVAEARFRFPLNLGDCFAYALAKDEECPLLTLDRDFRNCDIDVVIPRLH